MESIAQSLGDRYDAAEEDVDGTGTAWLFRQPDMPNPLTIMATDWREGQTKLGPAEFLVGVDRNDRRWSVLVGSVVLTKGLIEGTVEEWDDDKQGFVVKEVLGRVQLGEVVSIKYLGDRKGAKYTYPDFKISRKPPPKVDEPVETDGDEPAAAAEGADDDIPW